MSDHKHTDECWEPNSGCDMGRHRDYVEAYKVDVIYSCPECESFNGRLGKPRVGGLRGLFTCNDCGWQEQQR